MLKGRSKKSKEVHAKYLTNFSSKLFTTYILTVIFAPFATYFKSPSNANVTPVNELFETYSNMSLFLFMFTLVMFILIYTSQMSALDLLDEVNSGD